MADEIDEANELVQARVEDEIDRVRTAIRSEEKGEPGECQWCSKHSPRLVFGACAPCRDEFRLP